MLENRVGSPSAADGSLNAPHETGPAVDVDVVTAVLEAVLALLEAELGAVPGGPTERLPCGLAVAFH
jgi:hypothetical protein